MRTPTLFLAFVLANAAAAVSGREYRDVTSDEHSDIHKRFKVNGPIQDSPHCTNTIACLNDPKTKSWGDNMQCDPHVHTCKQRCQSTDDCVAWGKWKGVLPCPPGKVTAKQALSIGKYCSTCSSGPVNKGDCFYDITIN
ncbi:uncharacterized protein RSE6_03247 [Rhynchosporium secalis]|uniref:Uncharacterized protein n=1 Tax=Rhynchosporium secalis TaxID=38038 RepID=A0A1E1M2A3_RHYSE|nr:uncharacterized protein RSE6_03247 [Rhynchosporium secalis]